MKYYNEILRVPRKYTVLQLRRTEVAVPSNTAEKSSRTSGKELDRYLELAMGTPFEIARHLLIAFKLHWNNPDHFETFGVVHRHFLKLTC